MRDSPPSLAVGSFIAPGSLLRGSCLHSLGALARGAKQFQAELAIQPGDPDATYHLGFVDLQQSKMDDAKKLFEQVIAADPDYANAQYQLGKILLDRGQLQDAVPHLEAAARLSPDKEYVHYQLQAAYRKESRTADADRELAVYQELKTKSRPHIPQSTNPKSRMSISHLLSLNKSARVFISVSSMLQPCSQRKRVTLLRFPRPPGAKSTKCLGRPSPSLKTLPPGRASPSSTPPTRRSSTSWSR